MSRNRSIVEQLADLSVSVDCRSLPDEVIRKTKYCIMDALECCLNGNHHDPRTDAAWDYVSERTGDSVAFARGKTLQSGDAAFYNTVTGAVSSRNDISKSGSCHPGSIVVPVALALADGSGINGKRILEAVLVGYEAMIRLGIAIRLSPMPKAFRSTAILGAFGAAFTASRMLGLSSEQTVNAASFACHSAGGFNNWVSEGTGEDVLQNGWGARNGLEAALLAQTGLAAAKYILEDQDGFLAAFSALEQKGKITEELGHRWHILDVNFKPMCSCLKLMAPCQIAKKMRTEIMELSQIKEIRIGVADKTLHHAGTSETNVASQVQAIMSIPFGIANVLVTGDYSNISWHPPYQEEIRRIMKLCSVEEQPKLTAVFPEKRGAELTIVTKNGDEYSNVQLDAEGLTEQNIEELFCSTMAEFYGMANALVLKDTILTLEQQDNICRILDVLKGENTEL